jgi:Icc-related predicted phosphoesterase
VPKPAARALNILASADLHGRGGAADWFYELAAERKPELIVFAGDFITGKPLEFLREMLRELRRLAPAVHVIPGNWDPREALITLDEEAQDGLRNLHKAAAYCNGYIFAGLGGSITTPPGNTPMEQPDEGFADPLRPYLPADVWLLHQPLMGFRDRIGSGANVGSDSLRSLWQEQEVKPLLVLSGHIHEAGGVDVYGGSSFVNPGPLLDRRAAWISLSGDDVAVELLEG